MQTYLISEPWNIPANVAVFLSVNNIKYQFYHGTVDYAVYKAEVSDEDILLLKLICPLVKISQDEVLSFS